MQAFRIWFEYKKTTGNVTRVGYNFMLDTDPEPGTLFFLSVCILLT